MTAEIIHLNQARPTMSDDKPALDDGYCRVVNTLAEGLASHPITSVQQRVVWAVIRMTYGWQKGKDRIAAVQLADITGLTRQQCSTAVNQLIEAGVIIREGGSRSAIKMNTNIEHWRFEKKATNGLISERVNSNSNFCSVNSNSVHSTNSNCMHTKDKRQKEKNTSYSSSQKTKGKTSTEKIRPDAAIQNKSGSQYGYAVDLEIAKHMAIWIDTCLEQDAPANRNMADWANTIRLLRERDNREPAAIKALFAWSYHDDFWSEQILSPESLRRHWSKMAMKRKNQRKGGSNETGRTGSSGGNGVDKQVTDLDYARKTFED